MSNGGRRSRVNFGRYVLGLVGRLGDERKVSIFLAVTIGWSLGHARVFGLEPTVLNRRPRRVVSIGTRPLAEDGVLSTPIGR